MRLATAAEIETTGLLGGRTWEDHRCFLWTIVRQIRPGMRVRLGAFAPLPHRPIDINNISEDVAEQAFMQLRDNK